MLGFDVFEDGFDDNVGMRSTLAFRVRDQPIHHGTQLQLVLDALGKTGAGTLQRRRDALHALVLQRHGQAAQCAPGGDVASHDTSTDHVHTLRLPVHILAKALQPLLQEEDTNQIACRRRADNAVHQFRRRQRVAVVFGPDIDDCVGCRIVLLARALGDLFFGTVGDNAFQRTVEQFLHERQRPTRLIRQHQHTGGVLHHAWRHAVVSQPHAFGALGIDRLAGQHHVHCGGRANPFRQTQHATPAGENAEHHFRQPHLGSRLIDRQQIATSQCQFETPAKAMPTHQRQRRVRHRRQPVEQVPAALDQFSPFFGGV